MLDQKPTVIVLCSTWTLNVSFISGERLLKRSIIPFVTVVLFLLKYEYCVLYCRKSRKQSSKTSNNLQFYNTSMCIFMFSTYFSEMVSVSYSICFYLCSIIAICFT